MKKMIKKAILLIAMCISVANYANTTLKVKKENPDLIHITVEEVNSGSVISIKDDNGLILYKESVKKSGTYSKDFDLTALPDGNYHFEIDKPLAIKIIPFKVLSNTVTFQKEEEFIISKPRVVIKGDHVFISRLALENKPLEIKIYYEGYDLIHAEALNSDGQRLRRIYDFSKSITGNYEIVLQSEGRKFIKNIKI